MPFELDKFQDAAVSADYLTYLVDRRWPDVQARHNRLWNYFRNPLVPAVGAVGGALNINSRPYVQAQEVGLPARITGMSHSQTGSQPMTDVQRKEVVIENDIAWRVNTMVDFLFGRAVTIRSLAGRPDQAAAINSVVSAMFAANGGIAFFQELALLGAVYGFVDIALRVPADQPVGRFSRLSRPSVVPATDPSSAQVAGRPDLNGKGDDEQPNQQAAADSGRTEGGPTRPNMLARAIAMAQALQLETVEAPRVLPVLDDNDYHRTRLWVQKYYRQSTHISAAKHPLLRWGRAGRSAGSPAAVEVVEIISPAWWQRYEDRHLTAEGPNPLGQLPIVHVVNSSLPGCYDGLSEIEQLIPLQDELNTRLSDRANRVTYQSFKMYLGKGIDDFLDRPVGPGQMWATHNLDASIEEFGSDTGSPSEDAHIEQVRQAMDKVSGVTPLAAGLVRGNVGNLTSGTALRVVLSGLLARTDKKRLSFGEGLKQIVSLALAWLDHVGALRTSPADRQVAIDWPDPIPADQSVQLQNARIKAELGVPVERILAELGYESAPIGNGSN